MLSVNRDKKCRLPELYQILIYWRKFLPRSPAAAAVWRERRIRRVKLYPFAAPDNGKAVLETSPRSVQRTRCSADGGTVGPRHECYFGNDNGQRINSISDSAESGTEALSVIYYKLDKFAVLVSVVIKVVKGIVYLYDALAKAWLLVWGP